MRGPATGPGSRPIGLRGLQQHDAGGRRLPLSYEAWFIRQRRETRWTFLTGHGHALIVVTRDPNVRLREIAADLGVTERTAQTIVNDLVDAGYVARTRVGNRSRYEVRMERPFRHPVERDHAVGELLSVLVSDAAAGDEPAG